MVAMMQLHADELHRLNERGEQAIKAGNFTEAIGYYSGILDLYKEGVRDAIMGHALEYGGNACVCSGRYIEALEYYTIAIEEAERCGNTKVYEACTSNIGTTYAIFRDYERAIFYFEKAYQSAAKSRNTNMVTVATTNLVGAYCKKGDTHRAKQYLQLQIQTPFADSHEQQFWVLYNQGSIALADNNSKACIYYMQQAIETVDNHHMGDSYKVNVYPQLAEAYRQLGQNDSTLVYYHKVLDLTHRSSNPEQVAIAYRALAQIYQQIGQADSAACYQSLYIALNDSIFNQQQFNQAKERLISYENRVIDRTIGSLKNWIAMLIWGTLFFAMIVVIILLYNRKLHAAQRLLVQRNEELIRQNEESKRLRASYIALIAPEHLTNMAIQQPEQDSTELVVEQEEAAEPLVEPPVKTVSKVSLLSDERKTILLKDITEVMDKTEVIADPDFNLAQLAKMVNSNTKYVSTVINETYNKNFKTFLAEYRIRYAIKLLTDSDHYGHLTHAAIGEAVGYTSQNNFTLAFKKVIGVTPSVYKKLSENQPVLQE